MTDLRFAVRLLGRTPLTTTVALLTLALGIGATTTLFSVVNRVLLRPFPYDNPDRLVLIRADAPGGGRQPLLASAEAADLIQAKEVLASVGVIVPVDGNLTGDDVMERVPAASVSGSLLPTLGVSPALGRHLNDRADTTPDRVLRVLISHELWQTRYGSDPRILERTIEVNNREVGVAGVLPSGFRLYLGRDANVRPRIDVWFPLGVEDPSERRHRALTVIARLADGVDLERARERLRVLSTSIDAAHRATYGATPLAFHADLLQDDATREVRPALLALMGAVVFVLLIACANVAHLQSARTAARSRELALRMALGAARSRILRQLVTEGLLLGLAGAALGLLVAQWGESLLLYLRPASLPPVEGRSMDLRVLGFTVVAAVLASLFFTIVPALHATRRDLTASLDNDARTMSRAQPRLRAALIFGEVALAMVLLACAGLMIRTAMRLQAVDPGFRADGVLTLEAPMQPRAFPETARKWQFYRSAMERVRAVPGVQGVSGVRPLPLEGVDFRDRFTAGSSVVAAEHISALPGYFDVLGIRLIAGRDFAEADIEQERRVAIIDERFAREAWPGQHPIGQRIKRGTSATARELEVVGVVRHVRTASVRADGLPQVYLPYHLNAGFNMAMAVRVSGDARLIAAQAKKEIESLGGRRPVTNIRPLSDYVSDATADTRFAVLLLGIFAAIALTLAATGLYAVIAHTIAERRREVGVRMALGADSVRILRLIVADGMTWTAAGVLGGFAGAFVCTRYIESLLFGVSRMDAATLMTVALGLLLVALAACTLPALRALRIDPAEVLRS